MSQPLWLTPEARQARDRVVHDRGVEVFPDFVTDDPRMLALNRSLAEKLTDFASSGEIDRFGISDHTGLSGDFYALLNVGGRPMMQSNYPPTSNAKLRESLGLSADFVSARHRKIAEALFDAMFPRGAWEPTELPFSRLSSTCNPFFYKGVDRKLELANHVFSNVETIVRMYSAGKLQELYRDLKWIMAYYLVARLQPDSVKFQDGVFTPKAREVNDLEYAISGGRRGKRFDADKSLVINGALLEDHFRVRRRTAYGMAFMANIIWQAVIQPYRRYYGDTLGATFKHRGLADINRKIANFQEVVGTDVKQFDQSAPDFLIDFFVGRMPVRDDLKVLLRDMFSAPYYAPCQNVGEEGAGIWVGNPLDKGDFTLKMGLPSGISPNSVFGNYCNCFTYLCAADDHGGMVLERGVLEILLHSDPELALLTMSDDNLTCTSGRGVEVTSAWLRKLENGELISPYLKHELERPTSYLGGLLITDQRQVKKVVPNLKSFVVNWFVPERSVGSAMREAWFVGWLERARYYAEAPRFSHVKEILDREIRNQLGFDPDVMALSYKERYRAPFYAATTVDVEVLINPDTLNYKYSREDLSPELQAMFSAVIPAEESAKIAPFMEA